MENLLCNLNLPSPPQPSYSTFNTSRRNDPSFPPKTWASLVVQMVEHLPAMRETWVRFLGQEDPLEKEMAIHSSTLAWKIPWMEEPDRLQSMGSQRVRHDFTFTFPPIKMLLDPPRTHHHRCLLKDLILSQVSSFFSLFVPFYEAKDADSLSHCNKTFLLMAPSSYHPSQPILPASNSLTPLEKKMATHSSILAWRIP